MDAMHVSMLGLLMLFRLNRITLVIQAFSHNVSTVQRPSTGEIPHTARAVQGLQTGLHACPVFQRVDSTLAQNLELLILSR